MSYDLEQFKNKPFKRQLEAMINSRIYFTTDPGYKRQDGIPIYSLTGPALTDHAQAFESLIGKYGKLHSIEIDPQVFEEQQRQHYYLNQDKIALYKGEYFKIVIPMVGKCKKRGQYFDYDACSPLEVIIRDHLEDFRELAAHIVTNQKFWLSITFTTRNTKNSKRDEYLRQISQAFRDQGLDLINQDTYLYRDKQPMGTTLFEFKKRD